MNFNTNLIFDSHAHYDDEQFNEDRDELLCSMSEQGIGYVVNVGASIESSEASVELSKQYPLIYASVGVHPSETGELNADSINILRQLSQADKVVAVGEIGFDYHYAQPEKKTQRYWFEAQLELASEIKKPVIIHSREAAKDTMDMIKKYTNRINGGVIHCYSYSREMALEYVDMGYYIGIGGVLTFKNAKKLVETVESIPLDKLLLETDCPYLSPEPYRGKRNDSTKLDFVVKQISKIKGVNEEDIIRITCENAFKMYGIK